MIKCPNCGSTARLLASTPLYFDKGVWEQQRKCSCGCVTIIRYHEECERLIYTSGNEIPFINDEK